MFEIRTAGDVKLIFWQAPNLPVFTRLPDWSLLLRHLIIFCLTGKKKQQPVRAIPEGLWRSIAYFFFLKTKPKKQLSISFWTPYTKFINTKLSGRFWCNTFQTKTVGWWCDERGSELDHPCYAALRFMKGKDSQKLRIIHRLCRHRSFLLKQNVEQLKVLPF